MKVFQYNRYLFLTGICFSFVSISSHSQNPQQYNQEQFAKHLPGSYQLLNEILSIPNDAHSTADIEKNITWCEMAFSKRKFTVSKLNTKTIPLLLAERKITGAEKTVLIYLQLDGQPASGTWEQESPWKPVLKDRTANDKWQIIPWDTLEQSYNPEWRVFARSAADAKGPVAMFLTALDFIDAGNIHPSFNIKVIMDFEEELGSPQLAEAVDTYHEELKADCLLILDGPRHTTNLPTLIYGARGIATITLTTYGPAVNVHSGHYGNFIPNPAQMLSNLLAGMKNENGVVLIKGFYEGIKINNVEKKILSVVPDDDKIILRDLKINTADKVAPTYQESLQYPSLNIRGLSSGWTGKEARTIIPATAVAELDIRLVPESRPEKLIELIKKYITDKGYYITEKEPTDNERLAHSKICRFNYEISYPAFITPFESFVTPWLLKIFDATFNKKPVMIRLSGGSVPVSPFVNKLKIPAVIVPTVNPDNNQHSDNENIRLGNYVDGIKLFTNLLTAKF